MELWQAALIGLFAYLGRNQVPWLCGTTGGWYGIGRPLVAGLICGVILGDVTAGVLCGVAVQAIFIGQITPGGAVPSDLNLAAYIGQMEKVIFVHCKKAAVPQDRHCMAHAGL